jgi:ABC-type transport system involved in cytochrome bd biosynthesis fused ATPase/permease subunit
VQAALKYEVRVLGNDVLHEGEVLRVDDLRVAFDVNGSPVEVVKGVSFRVCSGAVTAVVGESGSGKSVTAQANHAHPAQQRHDRRWIHSFPSQDRGRGSTWPQ